MSQITYRANLSAAIFPLSLAQAGRSVIVPGPDNVYDRRVDPEGEQKNAGIPQAIYLENVIPTANGYQSVGYATAFAPPAGVSLFYQFKELAEGCIVYTTAAATKFCYSPGQPLDYWTDVIFVGAPCSPNIVIEAAIVRNVCYVFMQSSTNTELYTAVISGTFLTLTNVTASVLGITLINIRHIAASFNYLIAINRDGTVHWSSTTTPTDFTISLVTGAGSAIPNGTLITNNLNAGLGKPLDVPEGFYVPSGVGLIYAKYTGNSRYPWRFVPVGNITSISSADALSVNSSVIIVLENSGKLSRVEQGNVISIAPEVYSYLRELKGFDTLDYTTNVLTVTLQPFVNKPKLYCFYGQYIGISCEQLTNGTYGSMIIFDTVLKRYGKLKSAHHFVYRHLTGNPNIFISSTFGFLNVTGLTSKVVEFDIDNNTVTHQGVLILGKFQYVRSRNLQIHSAEIEGTLTSASQVLLPSLDGKTFEAPVAPYISKSTPNLLSCLYRAEAKNHSLVIKGQFAVESVELTFTSTGNR